MVSLFKAIFPGGLLTWIVAVTAARQGSSGGALYVHPITIGEWHSFWSWPMLAIALGLSWVIIFMLDGLR